MIEDLREFLAHAVQLEADAAAGYALLGARLRERGNIQLAGLFERLGEFSRLHLAETRLRYRELTGSDPPPAPAQPRWPDAHTPEDPRARALPAGLDERGALELALGMERGACDFYSLVANQSRDPAVQELAQVFADEESEHVDHLLRWMARL